MKTLKFLSVAFLAIGLSLNFTACDDDDDEIESSDESVNTVVQGEDGNDPLTEEDDGDATESETESDTETEEDGIFYDGETIYVKEAGTLETLAQENSVDISTLTTLKIKGYLNGDDISFIRWEHMKKSTLDLSEATIVEGGNPYYRDEDGSYRTANYEIGDYMFNFCYFESVILPNNTVRIGEFAFEYCFFMTDIDIPESVVEIGRGAFYVCSALTDVELPSGITKIEESLFSSCESLTKMKIPEGNGIWYIGGAAFSGCVSLVEVNIPDGVTTIQGAAFYNCRSLTEITIPSTVTDMQDQVFEYCYNLKDFYCYATTPPNLIYVIFGVFEFDVEGETPKSLYVPAGSVDSYKNSDWGTYFNYIYEIQ